MLSRLIRSLIVLACATVASNVHAAAALPPAADAAGEMPADIDVVVILDDLARLRTGAIGPAFEAIAGESLAGSEFARAWTELAARMGMGEAAMFDALLGRRIVFVARGMHDGEDGAGIRWAIVSEISAPTERRLRERLDVAPRTIVGGRPVLSVERGRYELTTQRRGEVARVVLAPAGDRGLLDEISGIGRGRAAPQTLRDAPQFDDLRALPPGDGLVYVRVPEPIGGWSVASLSHEGRTVRARVHARPGTDFAHLDAVAPWARSRFDAFASGALAAVMEHRPTIELEGGQAGANIDFLAMLPNFENEPAALAALGGRYAMAVTLTEDGAPSVAMAFEVRDRAAFAPIGDRVIDAALGGMGVAGQDFQGLAPDAVRVVGLSGADPEAMAAAGPLALLDLRERSIRWAFPRMTPENAGPDPAWWVIGGDAASYEKAAAAMLGPDADDEPRRWLSLGAAQPVSIVEYLTGLGLPLPGPLRAARHIERVDWGTELVDDRTHNSDIVITLRAPAGGS
ncbi:MAG: hypothetical protein EA379_09410 [Phycisphaerales bacterium]|nr:MAG: hypothetical protein EA379_09410 [Phycisphaerales bacterium]